MLIGFCRDDYYNQYFEKKKFFFKNGKEISWPEAFRIKNSEISWQDNFGHAIIIILEKYRNENYILLFYWT